mgnify:CR=1 FL=1
MSDAQLSEVDIPLLEFAQRYANTPLKRELVLLFGANPHIRDDSAGIARQLGRSVGPVARELEDLTLLGFLQRTRLPAGAAYQLTADVELRRSLARFTEITRKP